MVNGSQLKLFKNQISNPVYEIKRQIRIILSTTHMSRDQIADRMNDLSAKESMPGQKTTKVKIDSWCKDSDSSRLPSLVELVLFCAVVNDYSPLSVLADSIGCKLINQEEIKILEYGKADLINRKAARKRKLALEEIE